MVLHASVTFGFKYAFVSVPCRFVRRLLYFYKPTSKLYAGLALDHVKARQLTVVGCQFVEFLMDSDEVRKTTKQSKMFFSSNLLPNFASCSFVTRTVRGI